MMRGRIAAVVLASLLSLALQDVHSAPVQNANGTQAAGQSEITRLSAQVAVLYGQDKYDEALVLARRVVDLVEASSTVDALSQVTAYSNLGAIYIAKREGGSAVKAFLRAVEIYETQKLDRGNARLGNLYVSLGAALIFERDLSKAKLAYESALALAEQSKTRNASRIGGLLFRLGDLSQAQNEETSARANYRRALTIYGELARPLTKEERDLLESYFCPLYLLSDPKAENGKYSAKDNLTLSADLRAILSAPEGVSPKVHLARSNEAREPDPKPFDGVGGVINGKATRRIVPPYPREAKAERASGTVFVFVTIDEQGNVIEAKACSRGHMALQKAAEEAARDWKFSLTTLSGTPVKVTGVIIFNFTPR